MEKQLENFFNNYIGFEVEDASPYLEKFYSAKERLIKKFGQELIKEERIEIINTKEDLRGAFRDVVVHPAIAELSRAITIEDGRRFPDDFLTLESMYENKLMSDFTFVCSGNKIKIKTGTKVIKSIRKVIQHYNCNTDFKISENSEKNLIRIYEEVLDKKRISGTLCISIHPLDFFTMSENKNGWRSCFCIDGDYSNSPMILATSRNAIVTYLKSDKENLTIGDETWNSKKWRAYALADRNNNILLGKNYPFYSKELSKKAVSMIAETLGGVGDFYQYYDHEIIIGDKRLEVYADCDYDSDVFYDDFKKAEFASIAFLTNETVNSTAYEYETNDYQFCINCGDDCCGSVLCYNCQNTGLYKACKACGEHITRSSGEFCSDCNKYIKTNGLIRISDADEDEYGVLEIGETYKIFICSLEFIDRLYYAHQQIGTASIYRVNFSDLHAEDKLLLS